MPVKPDNTITEDELLMIQATARLLVSQSEKLLSKISGTDKKKKRVVSPELSAHILSQRRKHLLK